MTRAKVRSAKSLNATLKPLSTRSLSWIVVAGFVATLIMAAPASLLTPVVAAQGLEFRALEGRLWRGQIRGLTVSDIYFGDASFRFAPLELLTGRFGYRVSAAGGAATGNGVVALGLGGARLSDVKARFDLSAIKRYSIFGLAYDGTVRTDVRSVVLTRKGCAEANGEIWTDALDQPLRRLSGEGADLIGALGCDDDALSLAFDARNSKGEARITVRITPDFTYALNAAIKPTEDSIGRSLQLIGFEADDDALVYNAYGPLKGLGT